MNSNGRKSASQYDVVIIGLAITSSWGNGHATTYRSLVRGLAARGHRVLFLERDALWYAENRDEPHPRGAMTEIYRDFEDLLSRFEKPVSQAALVIVGSYVPEGARVGEWVTAVAKGRTAFYDIDTPVTLARLARGEHEYISPALIRSYDLYLSFTGGPTLAAIQSRYGSRMARVLYCSVDTETYFPEACPHRWDLGYLGTYSDDRQPFLDQLLLQPARAWSDGKFAVAGPQYPKDIAWPSNVHREIHLSPREHSAFYRSQRFTLNVTRAAMRAAGYSPSVRLFEAGACAEPIISDWWEGLDSVFEIGKEVLVARDADDTLRILRDLPEPKRLQIGAAARRRVLTEHTPEQRARQIEEYLKELNDNLSPHPSRRDRRSREDHGGVGAGVALESNRKGTERTADAASVASADSGSVYEPPGACH